MFIEGENRFPFRLIDVEGGELIDADVIVTFSLHRQGVELVHFDQPARWYKSVIPEKHIHSDGKVHEHQKITGLYVIDELRLTGTGIWYADFSVKFEGKTFAAQSRHRII